MDSFDIRTFLNPARRVRGQEGGKVALGVAREKQRDTVS